MCWRNGCVGMSVNGDDAMRHLLFAILATVLCACASSRLPPPRETVSDTLDPGIVPLTVEQARDVARAP